MQGPRAVQEGALLWEPDPGRRDEAKITRYIAWLARAHGLSFGSYEELWTWSVTDLDAFWGSLWDYFDVPGDRPPGPVHEGVLPDVAWFPGARLNYARQALRHAVGDRADKAAVVFRNEAGVARELTYAELAREVARVAAGLRALGVGRGDRVVAYIPNIPEAVLGVLGAASIGAVWSSCSPDFGARSVIDRFRQVEPKVLVAADGYAYNGVRHDRRDVVRQIEAELPSLTATILVPYLGAGGRGPGEASDGQGGLWWADFLGEPGEPDAPSFEEVAFGDPLWILYSSGTTGLPKAIVQSHGGIVLEHLKALTFHTDLGPEDTFFWFTTTGWMMWNYLLGGLLVGATVVLYDGSPGYPDLSALWRTAQDTGITYFGASAPYVTACLHEGLEPGRAFDLSAIRGVGSTGAPLSPEGFAWVYDSVGRDLLLGSLSGGTDLCTGFVGPCPLLPVRAGEIQCRCLGAKVEAFDVDGAPVVGEVGELVITEPMPSMPLYFWNDPGGRRYRESYFDTYPGVWRHGDWVKVTPAGQLVISGRSDSTLNRGGVRMGTSEFYRVLDDFPEIADSLVIDTGGTEREGRLLLFLAPADGHSVDDALTARVRAALRGELSPRHVPDDIHEVSEIPRTLSGKKLEVPVKKILQGVPVEQAANPDATTNPEALRRFADIASQLAEGR
ncbi:MAG: acetoacetate--CoA ligase [Carbonactinosporaceae bacterium]